MASPNAIAAAGIAGPAANVIGLLPISVTAAGSSSQANGTALAVNTTNFVTTGSGTDSVTLPSGQPGDRVEIYNLASTALNIYPPSGGTISGGSADAAVTAAQNKARILVCQTSKTWLSFSVVA